MNSNLQYFTNRHKLIRQFIEYLNNEPPPTKILFFHGDGGNGKSWLLKFLRENCCKRFVPKVWEQRKTQSNDKFISFIEKNELEHYTAIPAVILDFGQTSIDDKPQDRFYGLLMLRRKLAIVASELKCKLKFPRYDFACIWYLHKKGKSLKEIHQLFPSEETELISVLVDAFTQNGFANIFLRILNTLTKYLGQAVILRWKKSGIDEQWVTQLKKMELETELMDMLPHWFAQDLNAIMKNDEILKRIVLFFDTHEAFWGYEHNLPEESFFYRDEWLRRLLGDLDLSTGIIVVMAGREKSRWAESAKFSISHEKIDTQLVLHLSDSNAVAYLEKKTIFDANLQQALIKYASVKPNEVHPFLLSLCADVVLTDQQCCTTTTLNKFFATIREINVKSEFINLLLRYVDKETGYAIQALSACRTFDRELYFKLGDTLRFNPTEPTFSTLTNYEFVWQQGKHKNQYCIHNLLRRLYHESDNFIVNKAHSILEEYYRDHGNVTETIYHAICHDWQRGTDEWIKEHNDAQQREDFELCRILQEIREETHLHLEK